MEESRAGLLNGYRILDLTDEKGGLCGSILAELGADVIKVEPPGGDCSRRFGPFYHDIPDPEKSLYWFAFNRDKRGITLNLESSDGRELFRRLAGTADVVIESFAPGYMGELGLGYTELEKTNRGLIMTSISPFGQSGPYKDYKVSDLVMLGMGGYLYLIGDTDRPPVRISFPQAYLYAAAEASTGTMIALFCRENGGSGQWVDVSIQQSMIIQTTFAPPYWIFEHVIGQREGHYRTIFMGVNIPMRQTWPCKDGVIHFILMGGTGPAATNRALVEFMESKGMATDFLRQMDWDKLDMATISQETYDNIEKPLAAFFKAHTRKEIYDGALKRGIMLAPANTPKDILESVQLKSRGYWQEIAHPELDDKIVYPGDFVKVSSGRRPPFRAPLIGEHNYEVYVKELGLSKEDLVTLKQSGSV